MSFAYLFPGQGSQAVGMGVGLFENFSAARDVFQEVDEALGQKLFALLRDGPEDQLTLTENAQPALMAVSLAVVRVLEQDFGIGIDKALYAAGHSLGEYSALAATKALSLQDTARLLKLRGRAMQAAVPLGRGRMASLIGPKVDLALAETIAAAGRKLGVCEVANDNNIGNIVISGEAEAVAEALEAAKALGVRAVLLNVSAPFHCSLMGSAAKAMEDALAKVCIEAPLIPIVANITAEPESNPENFRRLLVQQVTGRVRWRETIVFLAKEGVQNFVELGSGKVLAGIVKRIAPEVRAISLGLPKDLEAFAEALETVPAE